MVREINFKLKHLRDGYCLYFVSSLINGFLAKTDFFKFTFETQPACVPYMFLNFCLI